MPQILSEARMNPNSGARNAGNMMFINIARRKGLREYYVHSVLEQGIPELDVPRSFN